MPLKFECSSCHKPIIVKFLTFGETAKCRDCGAEVVVPDNAVDSEETYDSAVKAPTIPATEQAVPVENHFEFRGKEAWSPTLAFWISALFGFLPGCFMLAYNYGQFGMKDKKWQMMFIIVPAFLLMLVLAISAGNALKPVGMGGILLAILHMYVRDQKKAFEDFIKKGGEKKGIGYPILMILGTIIFIIGASIVIQSRIDHLRWTNFKKGIDLFEKNNISEARTIFEKLKYSDTGDALGQIGLALIHEWQENMDSAKMELTLALKIDSSNALAQQVWTSFVEEHNLRMDGTITLWYDNGKKKSERTYKDGQLSGREITWYSNGFRHSQVYYSHGVENGEVQFWYESGKKMGLGNYRLGKRDGKFINWDENGNILSAEQYEDDILVGSEM